jgi:hypothetical protein
MPSTLRCVKHKYITSSVRCDAPHAGAAEAEDKADRRLIGGPRIGELPGHMPSCPVGRCLQHHITAMSIELLTCHGLLTCKEEQQ